MSAPNVIDELPLAKPLLTRNFVALLVTQTCFGMSFSTFFLLPKYLRQVLHANDLQIGTVAALGALAGVFSFPMVGALNDRFGRKPFILLGNALIAAASFAMLWVHDVGPLLYLLRALHGLCLALVFNSATTLVSDEVAHERLGHALSIFGSSLLATHALAPALAEPLAEHYGWRSVFGMASAVGVLGLLATLRVRDGSASRSDAGFAIIPLLVQARTRKVVLTIAAAGGSFGTVFTFHQPYALRLGMRHVSGFFMAYAACALLARLWLTSRLESIERSRLSAYGMLLYALAVLGAVFLRPGVLELVGAAMGIAQGVFYPVFNARAVEGVAAVRRGSMMALYHGGFNGGVALALLLGGAVAEQLGYPALFMGSATITATAAARLLKRPLHAAS